MTTIKIGLSTPTNLVQFPGQSRTAPSTMRLARPSECVLILHDRNRLGMTQGDYAAHRRVSDRTVRRWEAGEGEKELARVVLEIKEEENAELRRENAELRSALAQAERKAA